MTCTDHTDLERTSHDRQPMGKDFLTQRARQRYAGFESAFAHSQAPPPAADTVCSSGSMHRGFDQRPPQPWRAPTRDPAMSHTTEAFSPQLIQYQAESLLLPEMAKSGLLPKKKK